MIKEISRDAIVEMLREGVVSVKFTKKNGTIRDMECTLLPFYIPEDRRPKGTGNVTGENILRVYDIVEDDWRCFLVDNVLSVVAIIEDEIGV
jgi:hypothetical protein